MRRGVQQRPQRLLRAQKLGATALPAGNTHFLTRAPLGPSAWDMPGMEHGTGVPDVSGAADPPPFRADHSRPAEALLLPPESYSPVSFGASVHPPALQATPDTGT